MSLSMSLSMFMSHETETGPEIGTDKDTNADNNLGCGSYEILSIESQIIMKYYGYRHNGSCSMDCLCLFHGIHKSIEA